MSNALLFSLTRKAAKTSQVRESAQLQLQQADGLTKLFLNPAIAQRTADWLGVDLQPVQVDEETLAARFEETVWHSEVALPDLNGVCRLALSEAVHARGIKVVITGELPSLRFSRASVVVNSKTS